MSRSNDLMIPISGQGIIVDPGTKDILQKAMVPPIGYTDLLLYSHGWWSTAETAMIDDNRFRSPAIILTSSMTRSPGW